MVAHGWCGAHECGRELRVYSPPDPIFVRVEQECWLTGSWLELLPSLLMRAWTVSALSLAPAGVAAFLCLGALLPLKLPSRAPLGD